jgi:hypothetical protein
MTTKSKRGRRATVDSRVPAAAAAETTSASVGRRIAIGGIDRCAGGCTTDEARGRVHALARATRRGAETTRRAAALEGTIATVLDEAAAAGPDRWACAEAAAWALGRLVRRRPAAGSAGRHLERIVAEARSGAAALADRDTRPARFVLVLARLFADVEACRDFEKAVAAALVEEIARLTTPDGAVVLAGSTAVVERVCRWTAVRAAALSLGGPAWDDDAERRWSAAAASTLRLLGTRGRGLAGGGQLPAAVTAPLVDAVSRAKSGRARRTARSLRRGEAERGLLPLDHHDPAAAVAVIRSGWGRNAVRVSLEYRDAAPRLEIAVGDRLLVDGAWEWATTAGGRSLDADGAWTVSCWEVDRKAAFVEIAAPLAGGLRIEREVVVLRRERIVLLADAIVPAAGGDATELAHRVTVPLAAALEAEAAAETREVLVYDGGMRLMALPLALPEWRVAGRGSLEATDGRLVLEHAGQRRLYAPLWLDCDPRRIGLPLTWRQLTVADTRRNLPPQQAAGFRVQSGDEQWLLYRALDAVRNRTLLGCNVSCGFLLGRIRRSGEVARTVEIE